MRDYLLDVVTNTHGLDVIEMVKIIGTEESTLIEAVSKDRTVVVKGQFNTPIKEFVGVFGMPNLAKLKTILEIPEYSENAKISVVTRTKDDVTIPAGLHFENATGDFTNDYRFMTNEQVTGLMKNVTFRGVNWNVEFEPDPLNIQRLIFQSKANKEETNFVAKTDGTDLKIYFGDQGRHAGNFVFHTNVTGTLVKNQSWPIKAVIKILERSGDKIFRISDGGAAQITVNTGIATYNYVLPAQK